MKKLFKLAIVAAVVKVGYDRITKRRGAVPKSPGVTVDYNGMAKQNLKKGKRETDTIDDIPKPIRSGRYPWGEAPKSP